MFETTIKIKRPEDLVLQLPENYMNKEVKITVDEVGEAKPSVLKSFEEEKAFFQSIAVNMSDYKFDRNEANGH
jgi:hypothetical protein